MENKDKQKTFYCYICKEKKPKTDFHSDNGRKQGVCSTCKTCAKKRTQHNNYLREYAKKYALKKENIQKLLTRMIMRKAIKSGILVRKPCIVCGNKKAEGHHQDYSKPLDIKWLCDLHHQHLHRGILKL